ncbi:MAG: AbrB/MazE/SpoVT family DNA-binding domain-containing protein [Nitrososphaerales archaeon]
MGFEEGLPVKYRIEDSKLVVEAIRNPLDLALSGRKWAKTTIGEFERESGKEQKELYG